MPRSVIAYDKELPEIPDRRPWEKPSSYLVKDVATETGWREEKGGRRQSRLLLVPKLRAAVDVWREGGYEGASDTTRRLFEHWFDDDHEVANFPTPFRYHFCQREAIETLVWLVEIAGERDAVKLISRFATIVARDLVSRNIEFQTRLEEGREIRTVNRYVPELERVGVHDLPPQDLRRFALKMATGSGKTWVMAMAIVWSYFHRRFEVGSSLSTNFLIVAPNVIVYQRLEKDFGSGRIFNELPLIPPEWKGQFDINVILRDDAREPAPSGNLFLTNIQQIYESRETEWTAENAVEALLGRKPSKDLAASGQRPMLERMKSLSDLLALNDEAHHVHDEELAWSRALIGLHDALPKGLAAWLDFSATPKNQAGMYFPWTICDYPLAQAVEDRIVKAPIIITNEGDSKRPPKDPDGITKKNVAEKYGYWIRAAVDRWRAHSKAYKKYGRNPVLFIMVEKTAHADALGEYLWKTKEFGFKEREVLVIHTDTVGEVTKADLEKAREAARDIDKPGSKIKAIVSVMMLREGWDVRNVSIVLGLRPFTAHAEILPEQVIGRGLRLMTDIGPDRTQSLEVLGTANLLKVLREQLEVDGVGFGVSRKEPQLPVMIAPMKERIEFDISIPLTKPSLVHNVRRLDGLRVAALDPIFEGTDLSEPLRLALKLEFATTGSDMGMVPVDAGESWPTHELLASITSKTMDLAKITGCFAQLYPLVQEYVSTRCFGVRVDPENEKVRSHLSRLDFREGIAAYLARKIGELIIERHPVEFDKADFRLSDTKRFSWRRNLPPMTAKKTVFNHVATYNPFERRFAEFLEKAKDVHRFASLGTTEQGDSGTQFRVDYLKPSGAIGFYHPDWVVVQKSGAGDVNWIIETKGRVWEGTTAKDEAMKTWCKRISEARGESWHYVRVNQKDFDGKGWSTLTDLLKGGGAQLSAI